MAMQDPRSKEDMQRAKDCYEKLIEPLRACARAHGYALGVHGSVSRDIDLIAVPWVGWACKPKELADAIQATAARVNSGIAINSDASGASNPGYFLHGCPGSKASGRRTWTFHLGGGPYIDLSVFPPAPDEEFVTLEGPANPDASCPGCGCRGHLHMNTCEIYIEAMARRAAAPEPAETLDPQPVISPEPVISADPVISAAPEPAPLYTPAEHEALAYMAEPPRDAESAPWVTEPEMEAGFGPIVVGEAWIKPDPVRRARNAELLGNCNALAIMSAGDWARAVMRVEEGFAYPPRFYDQSGNLMLASPSDWKAATLEEILDHYDQHGMDARDQ